MLLTQINGDDPAVARAALSVLEEATQDERCLRTLVNDAFLTTMCHTQACCPRFGVQPALFTCDSVVFAGGSPGRGQAPRALLLKMFGARG